MSLNQLLSALRRIARWLEWACEEISTHARYTAVPVWRPWRDFQPPGK